jgi:hypothetical protein
VNVVEMLMLSMNRSLNPHALSVVVWKLNDGRLTMAFGRAPDGLGGVLSSDLFNQSHFGNIVNVEFMMNS